MEGKSGGSKPSPGELRKQRRASACRSALGTLLGPVFARSARRACRRMDVQGLWTSEQRSRREAFLVRWAEAWLGGGAGAESAGHPDSRTLLELGLTPRDAFFLLSELRSELTKALFDAQETASGPVPRAAMVGALQLAFDEALFELLQGSAEDLRRRLAREERLVMVGQLVASLIHELRNPLSVIDTSLLLLERRAGRGQSVELHVGRARAQVDRSRKMIDDLLDMLRERPTTRRPVALGLVIEASLDALGSARSRVKVKVEEALSEVDVDAGQIQQVVLNLLTNALEASDVDSEVQVRAWSTGPEVVLEVEDEGPGIAAEILPTLFEPLVSTKPDGVGLGLAVSRRLAEQNLGRLEARNDGGGGGAVFRLTLPVPSRPTEPPLPGAKLGA